MLRVVIVEDPEAAPGVAGVLARRLRDEGHEVIYLVGVTPEQAVAVAVQEDAARIDLPGAAPAVLERVRDLLAAQDADDIAVRITT